MNTIIQSLLEAQEAILRNELELDTVEDEMAFESVINGNYSGNYELDMYSDFDSLLAMEALRPEIIDNYKSDNDDKTTINAPSNSAKSPWYKRIGGAIKKVFTTIINFFKSIGEKIKNFFLKITKKRVDVSLSTGGLDASLKKYIDSVYKHSNNFINNFNSASTIVTKFLDSKDLYKINSTVERNYQKLDELDDKLLEDHEALQNLNKNMSDINKLEIPTYIRAYLTPVYDLLKDTQKSCESLRKQCESLFKIVERQVLSETGLQYSDTGSVYIYKYTKYYLDQVSLLNSTTGIILSISSKLENSIIRSN